MMQHRLADLLRHGEAVGGPCFRGERDDPLSAQGWAQLEAATGPERTRAAPVWRRILCSPAVRCAAFATDLGGRLELPVTPLPAFRERGFGAWEGLRAEQIPAADLARFWSDPLGYDPPEAEPFAAFRARVARGWTALTAGEDPHLLLIAHGGVIRVILGEVLGLAAERLILLEVPPACRSRLRLPLGGGLPSLVAHGALPSAAPAAERPPPAR